MRRLFMISGVFFLALLAGCSQATQTVQDAHDSGGDHPQKQQKESVADSVDWGQLQSDHHHHKDQKKSDSSAKGLEPTSVAIPKLGVKADATDLGMLKNGEMAVPKNAQDVGWYKNGVQPGQKGRAVLAGHTEYDKQLGVFHHLDKLNKGDFIYVTNKKGKRLKFKVNKKDSVSRKSKKAVKEAFGYTGKRSMAMITCEGQFNEKAGTHEKRMIVYASLVNKK